MFQEPKFGVKSTIYLRFVVGLSRFFCLFMSMKQNIGIVLAFQRSRYGILPSSPTNVIVELPHPYKGLDKSIVRIT